MAGKCCARNFFIQPFSHPHQIQTVDPFMNTTSTYHFRSSMVLHHWYNKTCYRNRSRDVSSPQGFFFFPSIPEFFFSLLYNITFSHFLFWYFSFLWCPRVESFETLERSKKLTLVLYNHEQRKRNKKTVTDTKLRKTVLHNTIGISRWFGEVWDWRSSLMCTEFSDLLLIKRLGFNFYKS